MTPIVSILKNIDSLPHQNPFRELSSLNKNLNYYMVFKLLKVTLFLNDVPVVFISCLTSKIILDCFRDFD